MEKQLKLFFLLQIFKLRKFHMS